MRGDDRPVLAILLYLSLGPRVALAEISAEILIGLSLLGSKLRLLYSLIRLHHLRFERVGLRFNGGDAQHLGVMIERLLVDDRLRDRLVTEASEYVLRFDWDDVARRTRAIYSSVASIRPRRERVRRG